ncbi:YitT family protein [Candidatus Soleaferrea massiliensis]|uniref:YitT family protein n=1 Tax=Candidatus Soleaferrea massiliensis TaxID=1470354 RepID=UPI00058FE731|nr:YitT family protein [Candidatus Soleaferrea massiliensis]
MQQKVREYALITLSTFMIAAGVYFFKFQNNFSFGGVTGAAVVISKLFGGAVSSSTVNFVISMALLVVGFVFLGKKCGIKTTYSSILLSVLISVFSFLCPLDGPITDSPMLELCFAIGLPAFGSALLFNMGASSGGTDIIAMIVKKYSRFNIGRALLFVDALITLSAFLVFDLTTALYSILGLMIKSLMIDTVIESINLCKYFNIVCVNPEPICDYITQTLNRSATICDAEGAFSQEKKTIIFTVVNRPQAVQLRKFIKQEEPSAFILISNTSEIIGRGFHQTV